MVKKEGGHFTGSPIVPFGRLAASFKKVLPVFPCHDIGGRRLREDSWTSTATWTMDYRWVGYTVFELKDEAKKEEKEKPASTKNDGGEDESDKRKKEQWSADYGEQPSSSMASVGASVTYAPTINVSVNVDGRRVTTSMRLPRQSHASSLDGFELVSEDEKSWP